MTFSRAIGGSTRDLVFRECVRTGKGNRRSLHSASLRSELVTFLIWPVVCGWKARKSICQQASPGFPRLCSGQALRLRAISRPLCDRSARRFAQDDRLCGGEKHPVRLRRKHEKIEKVTGSPNEQTKSVVPHLRRSTACLWTQPFRAGLIFGAGPLGLDCKHRFPMFIPPLTCPGKSVARDDKGEASILRGKWLLVIRGFQI